MKNEMIKYEKPEMETISFQTTDVVCASVDNDNTAPDPFDTW